MEFIMELILELALEGSIEASKSSKVPKLVRYFLIFLISLFFISVIGVILFTGILLLKDNIIAGTIIIALGLVMLILNILKFRKIYLIKIDSKI